MSQPLSLEYGIQTKNNKNEMVQTQQQLKDNREQKVINLSNQSKVLKQAVEQLRHEHKLLDKQLIFNESFNMKVEKEINVFKAKTEKVAFAIENVRWNIFKTNMVKQLEIQLNESMDKRKSNLEVVEKADQNGTKDSNKHIQYDDNDEVKQLRDEIKQLSEEIYAKNKAVQMTDSKLFTDIQKLEKRNAALQLRYQRQHQEAESRYRQRQSELNSLQKLLTEKNYLLGNVIKNDDIVKSDKSKNVQDYLLYKYNSNRERPT